MKHIILSGCIGGLVVILLLIAGCVFFEPFNYRPVRVINPEKIVANNDTTHNTILTCSQIEILRDLENKGLLLTPHEYTSHISSYYTTLIAFLIGLFVLFTIGSIFSIKMTSQKEIDEAKRDLDNREEKIKRELKQNIQASLAELLKDSISFKENVINAMYGRIEDDLITRSDKQNIENKLNKLETDINFIFESLSDISDTESSKEEIE